MVDGSGGASRKVLLSLFWALQGSLLSWCYLQLKGAASTSITVDLARDILLKCERDTASPDRDHVNTASGLMIQHQTDT